MLKKSLTIVLFSLFLLCSIVNAKVYLPISALNSSGGDNRSNNVFLENINASDNNKVTISSITDKWLNLTFNVTDSPDNIYLAMEALETVPETFYLHIWNGSTMANVTSKGYPASDTTIWFDMSSYLPDSNGAYTIGIHFHSIGTLGYIDFVKLEDNLNISCGQYTTASVELTDNITCNSQNGIGIAEENVTIDCNGFTLNGTSSSGTYGIFNVYGSSGFYNTSVKDCNIIGFDTGIYLYKSNYGKVLNNNISLSFGGNGGIYIYDSNTTQITNNNATHNDYGLYMQTSYLNSINDNYLDYNDKDNKGYGLYLYQVHNTTFDNIFTRKNDLDGVYMTDSSYNTFDSLTSSQNKRTGFYLHTSSTYGNNTLQNSEITLNDKDGVKIYGAADTLLSGNKIKYNLGGGVNLTNIALGTTNISTNNFCHHNNYELKLNGSSGVVSNTFCIDLHQPVNNQNISSTREFNFTYYLSAINQSEGNCSIYMDNTIQNISSYSSLNTVGNNTKNLSVNSSFHLWYVTCTDAYSNTATSPTWYIVNYSSDTSANVAIDTVANVEKALNMTGTGLNITMSLTTSENANGTVSFNQYKNNPTYVTSGFASKKLGIYADIDLDFATSLSWAIIRLYYNDSQVNNINESTLRLYHYNTTVSAWQTLPGGVNTSGNYVWGNTTHFSFFGSSGNAPTTVTPTTTTTSSSGGSGGGGYAYELSSGTKTLDMGYGDVLAFKIENNRHTAVLIDMDEETIKIRVRSEPIDVVLREGEVKNIDVDFDGTDDISITCTKKYKKSATVLFKILDKEEKEIMQEPIGQVNETGIEKEQTEEDMIEEKEEKTEEEKITPEIVSTTSKESLKGWTLVILLVVIGIGIFVFFNKKNKK